MYDKEDPDTFVNMVNAKQTLDKYQATLKMSTDVPVVPFKTQKKEKPSNYKAIICSTILLLSLSFGVGVYTYNDVQAKTAYQTSSTALAKVVIDNTHYGDYRYGEDRYWWYDINAMAQEVLQGDAYDIDTRIYGCYKNMKAYNKNEHMNSLFWEMQTEIAKQPELYSEDIKAACNYKTFSEYLEAKGLTLEEYQKIMDQILTAYGKDENSKDAITALLNELNGYSTRGGRK